MKNYYIPTVVFLLSSLANAMVPDVVITTLISTNGHATVAGRLTSKPQAPVGISVRNGNLMYSTLTDGEGRWGIVIRHQSIQVEVTSWSLANAEERGREVTANLDSSLPWSKSVSGSGSSSSETSAKYRAETSIRSQIDSARSRCSSDKGSFSYSGGSVYCSKSGSNYNCSGTASCHCN